MRYGYIAIVFVVCALLVTGVLFISSSGKQKPFLDKNGKPLPGSISEKTFINVNGVKQGMFIKSKDATHPVLLFLHGGLPFYFLTQKYPTDLEEYFTVVWWEQRGSGLSYDADAAAETITVEQLISDTVEVTNHLRRRFNQEKIFLMGHSGGTFIGMQTAARTPNLYHAYIAVAQMSDQLKSETLAYEHMLKRYREIGDSRMVRKLEATPITRESGTPRAYLSLRDRAMHSLGIGTTRDMKSVPLGIFTPSLMFSEYSLREKINLWRGKLHSGVHALWHTMLATDLSTKVTRLQIPVYFLHGMHDYTVSYPLAKAYFDRLDAPLKGFYTFEKSAHTPFLEEPQKMGEILKWDVLKGTKQLADPA